MNNESAKLDRLNWISTQLKIIDKAGQLVYLYPNIGQLMLDNTIMLQKNAGVPVRVCLLKPRRVGWSTWCVADNFYEIDNTENISALEVSADDDATNSIFCMAKLFYEGLPNQKQTDYSNRKEIVYSAPHRSKIVAQTAGKLVLGRGSTYQRLHCSEVAFWRNAAQQLGGLYQVVSKDVNTSIILESTGNGVGGAFHDTFWTAVDRVKANKKDINGFLPVFFPWYKFPEYSLDIPNGVELNLTGEESEFVSRYKLTNNQIYWRRSKITELNGDVDFFKQEYPANPKEAFQFTGRSVFPPVWIDKQYAKSVPGRTGVLYQENERIEIKDISRESECWRIWHKAQYAHQYTIGVDTMEGRLSDPDNPRSKTDWHGVVVFDRTNQIVCAQYHGRCTQQELAEQVELAGRMYNNAWIGVELPNGKTVLDYLRGKQYQNLYRRQTHDLQDSEMDTDDYGWRTTTITRPWLVDGLIGVIRDNDLVVYSSELLDEMRTFIRDKTGKPMHRSGEHDDLLFALMIAIQIHVRCSLNATSYPSDHTGGYEHNKSLNMAMPNVIDDESDMYSEVEDGVYTV